MKKLIAQFVAVVLIVGCSGPRQISFPTEDGGRVSADLYGSGAHGVVLAHGARFDKESWSRQAEELADFGFQVVAIDFRGYGDSVGGAAPGSRRDLYLDVLAAVRYLRGDGSETVSVMGGSMGGGAAARAAVEAEAGEIDRLILLAATPIANPEQMQARKLFVVTRGDSRGGGALRLPGVQDQFDRAAAPKELLVLDGSAHAQHIFESEQGEALMEEILKFLAD